MYWWNDVTWTLIIYFNLIWLNVASSSSSSSSSGCLWISLTPWKALHSSWSSSSTGQLYARYCIHSLKTLAIQDISAHRCTTRGNNEFDVAFRFERGGAVLPLHPLNPAPPPSPPTCHPPSTVESKTASSLTPSNLQCRESESSMITLTLTAYISIRSCMKILQYIINSFICIIFFLHHYRWISRSLLVISFRYSTTSSTLEATELESVSPLNTVNETPDESSQFEPRGYDSQHPNNK